MNLPTKKVIETHSAPAPVGPYSQAILVNGWLYCSGQIALDPSSGLMVGDGDVEEETHQVLKNLEAVLNSAKASPSDVVRTTIYLKNLSDFAKVNKIYSEVFENSMSPARACVEVAGLPKGALVEIDCIALIEQD